MLSTSPTNLSYSRGTGEEEFRDFSGLFICHINRPAGIQLSRCSPRSRLRVPPLINEGELARALVSTNICAASHGRRWSQIQQQGGVFDFWKSNEDVSLVSFVRRPDQKLAHPNGRNIRSGFLRLHLLCVTCEDVNGVCLRCHSDEASVT